MPMGSEQEPHRHLNRLKAVAGAAQLISLKMVEQSGLSLPLMATSTQYIKPAPYFDFLRKLWLKHGGFKCKSLGIHLMAKLCCASTLVFSHVLVSAASCLQNSLMPSIFVLITTALRMDHSRQSDSLGDVNKRQITLGQIRVKHILKMRNWEYPFCSISSSVRNWCSTSRHDSSISCVMRRHRRTNCSLESGRGKNAAAITKLWKSTRPYLTLALQPTTENQSSVG